MKLIVFGSNDESEKLYNSIIATLEELGLGEFIETKKSDSDSLKTKLGFKKEPALIVEEENIDFIDVISEGIVPNDEDLKGIIISIIGGNPLDCSDNSECGTSCFC